MSNLRRGMRVAVLLPIRRETALGVCVEHYACGGVLVILDQPLPKRIRFTREEEKYAESHDVDLAHCKWVRSTCVSEHVQILTTPREEQSPTSLFLCSACRRIVMHADAVFLCSSHVCCWKHLIPENPTPDIMHQLQESINVCAAAYHQELSEKELSLRALLVYEQYMTTSDEEKEQLLQHMLTNYLPCKVDNCLRTISIPDIATQLQKKDGDGPSMFQRFVGTCRKVVKELLRSTSDEHEDAPSDVCASNMHEKSISALCKAGHDRRLCEAVVAQMAQAHPHTNDEAQFLAFCFEAMQESKSRSETQSQSALGARGNRVGQTNDGEISAGRQQSNGYLSPTHSSLQKQRNSNRPPDRSSVMRILQEEGYSADIAEQSICSTMAEYPHTQDPDRLLEYCRKAACAAQEEVLMSAASEGTLTTTSGSSAQVSSTSDCKASVSSSNEAVFQGRVTQQQFGAAKYPPADSTKVRELALTKLEAMGFSWQIASQALQRVVAQYPNTPCTGRFLGYCYEEAAELAARQDKNVTAESEAKASMPSDQQSQPAAESAANTSSDRVTRSQTKAQKMQKMQRCVERVASVMGELFDRESVEQLLQDIRDWERRTDDDVVQILLDKLTLDGSPTTFSQRKRHDSDGDMHRGNEPSAPVAAAIGQALANAEEAQACPMDVTVPDSRSRSYSDHGDLKQDSPPPHNEQYWEKSHRPVTAPNLRISARHPRTNSKRVLRLKDAMDYDALRDYVMDKYSDELCDADARDASKYSLYLGDDEHFSLEITAAAFGEEADEATRLVVDIQKDAAVYLRHVNDNVGPKQSLAVLASSFKFNQSMRQKISDLRHTLGYKAWRRIRGDGNCYYRAVLYGYLEQILTHDKRAELLHRFLATIESVHYNAGSEDAHKHDALLQELRAAVKAERWGDVHDFEACILDQTHGMDLALIQAVRRVIGSYMLEHAQDNFHGISLADTILTSYPVKDMEQYVEQYVHKLGEDAEGSFVDLGVMFSALGIRGRTVFLDRRSDVDLTVLESLDDSEGLPVVVHLLLRPGHYDLLYM